MKISRIINQNRFVTKIRKNITWKLFIITALVFIIFISSTLTFQSLFFGRFYINKKESNMLSQVEKFRASYNKIEDEDKLANLIRKFEQDNNAKIVIIDKYGKMKFITKPDSQSYDAVRIKAINDIIINWTMNTDLLEQVKRDNKPVTVITDRKINGTRNILTVVPNKKSEEIIFSITSLQPVDEASSVIKEFYFYFYIGAVVLILILCLMYTNMLSKPLVKLNDTAKKMAAFDFSEKCNIKNEDEIGNLANTLNFLSDNLDKALTSLKVANEKLEKDIKKERNIDKARKEFIAAVSHELKTPINLIEGYAEGLKDGIFKENEKDQYIDIIIDESNKMANLVSDMLNLSHLESGTMELSKEEFFVDDLIESVIKRFYKVIMDKGITIGRQIIGKTKLYADWDKMEQVITNFTTNAIKNTYNGGKIIFAIEQNSNKIIVSVENTGKGIPEEELNKVWDNFYKLDKSRNRELGGTGIGLAIVKNILILHGYKYGVKNTDNGVKFYFVVKENKV